MAKNVVRFIRAHVVEHEATVLESKLLSTGELSHVADIPASTTTYIAGQEVTFRNKKDAQAFVKAMGGAAIHE